MAQYRLDRQEVGWDPTRAPSTNGASVHIVLLAFLMLFSPFVQPPSVSDLTHNDRQNSSLTLPSLVTPEPSPERDDRAAPTRDARRRRLLFTLLPDPRQWFANGPANQAVLFLGTVTTQASTIRALILSRRPTFSQSGHIEPRFAHALRHDWPAVDELLVVVRALREETGVVHCETPAKLTLRMVMVSNHRRSSR